MDDKRDEPSAKDVDRKLHASLSRLAAEAAQQAPAVQAQISPGAIAIAEERARQMTKEGWTPEHDDEHIYGQLSAAAACYATAPIDPRHRDGRSMWPWDEPWDKRKKHDRRQRLVIAGALLAAEIDRLDRANGIAAPVEVLALFGEAPPEAAQQAPAPAAGCPICQSPTCRPQEGVCRDAGSACECPEIIAAAAPAPAPATPAAPVPDAVREAALRVIEHASHSDNCAYWRACYEYNKDRGPCPDEEDCDCGVYALRSALAAPVPPVAEQGGEDCGTGECGECRTCLRVDLDARAQTIDELELRLAALTGVEAERDEARARLAALEAATQGAPHGLDCRVWTALNNPGGPMPPCDCWRSRVASAQGPLDREALGRLMREAYYDSKNLTPWDDLGALADDADYKENFCRAAEAVASVVRADGDRFLLEADRQATQFMLERDAAVAAAIQGEAQPPLPADRLSLIADLVSGLPHDSDGTAPYLALGRNAESFDLIAGMVGTDGEGLVNGDYATVRFGGMWFEAKKPTEGK